MLHRPCVLCRDYRDVFVLQKVIQWGAHIFRNWSIDGGVRCIPGLQDTADAIKLSLVWADMTGVISGCLGASLLFFQFYEPMEMFGSFLVYFVIKDLCWMSVNANFNIYMLRTSYS